MEMGGAKKKISLTCKKSGLLKRAIIPANKKVVTKKGEQHETEKIQNAHRSFITDYGGDCSHDKYDHEWKRPGIGERSGENK